MWDERKGLRERKREKEKIQLFFHFTSCKKPFSSHSERAEGKLGELCDSWWNFVQLLLVSQHNLLNHFRKSLNRLRHFFPVCDTRKKEGERKREKKTENFIIFAIFDNLSPRYLYLYIPQDRISKDFWIYAVKKRERKKERKREWERARERNDNYICPVSETFIEANGGYGSGATRITPEDVVLESTILCVCVHT